MRLVIIAGTAALACLATACAPLAALGVGAPGGTAKSDLHEFLTDPNCSHDDEATFVSGAGGIPASFQAKVARHCEARPQTPSLRVGDFVPASPPQ